MASLLSDSLQPELAAILAAKGILPASAGWQRLGGGRTNHIWRVTTGDSALVVKLYATPTLNPLFPNDPDSEAAVLTHLSDAGLAPALVATLDTNLGAVLIYTHLAGPDWSDETPGVARLLGALHDIPPPSGLRQAPDGSAALHRQTQAILAKCQSSQALELAAACPPGEVEPCHRQALLHGDPVPGNIIQTTAGLRLIDWQCPAIGDPCEDLALFLSPAMQLAYRGAALLPDQAEAFLATYPDQEIVDRYRRLAPWYHWRMAAYCLWKHEQGHHEDHAFALAESKFLPEAKKILLK